MQKPEPVTFDDWWALQFHKVNRAICEAKWNAITSEQGLHTRVFDKSSGEYMPLHLKATGKEIYAAQKRQNNEFFARHGYNNEREKQFLRRPQQWLNQGGWMDE